MAGEAEKTTDHDRIRAWAQARDARPPTPAGTREGGEPGVLTFMFAGADSDEDLDEISWSEFEAKFEREKLAMLYQHETASGAESRFFKFVDRDAPESR